MPSLGTGRAPPAASSSRPPDTDERVRPWFAVTTTRINFKGRVVLCGGISQYNSTNPTGPVNYLTLLTQRARMEGFIITDDAPRFAEGVKRRARRGHRRPCGTP